MAEHIKILVLSDNAYILERAKPIFRKRKVMRWTFTNSDDINPKKDFQHIIDTYDLVFSLHCKKIFPKVLTDYVRCVNIHPGFNPYNRGVFPHVFSIINKLPAGVTIHEMDEGIDTGPIIAQKEVFIDKKDTSTSMYNRLINTEMTLIDDSLDAIIKNDYVTFKVDNHEYLYNSMNDFKKLCDISPIQNSSFGSFYALLRALWHAGYMNAQMDGIKFKLIIDENNHPTKD